jgi:iron only hydrogenase large subunit-like protein
MKELGELRQLLQNKTPMTAMLAPSFVIMYEYPQIVARLKKLGFAHVIEVTAGANLTNQAVIKVLQADPKSRFITSPCPSIVRMIRTKYPELKQYLAFAADSPMVATARLVLEKFPGTKPVFLGPCNAKTLEASEDYPELGILSVPYRDLDVLFQEFNIGEVEAGPEDKFDIEFQQTRLYPISGGLAQSSEVKKILAADQIEVVSGWQQDEPALKKFATDEKVRLLDILFCNGGCVSGPGINSPLTLEQRREKVINFWQNQSGWVNKIRMKLQGRPSL